MELLKGSIKIFLLLLITFLLVKNASADIAQDNPHGNLSLDCMACHTVEGWDKIRRDMQFDHGSTSYPLEGRHEQVECLACHTDLAFSGTSTECISCHNDIHENQFGNSCEQCHTPSRWFDELFFRTRHLESRFQLTGIHEGLDCQSCHADGQYVGLTISCIGCHLNTFENTVNPDHVSAEFSVNCQNCHGENITNWNNASYIHTSTFPLVGGHNVDDCLACHSAQYIGISTQCFSCHESDFVNAGDPDHTGFSTDCEDCHTTINWQPAEFDHTLSGFVLDGAHLNLDCIQCHETAYTGTPNTCYGCHQSDFENTPDPEHIDAGFSNDCLQCHNTGDWNTVQFDHANTEFQLTGAHIPLDCNDCHSEGYTGTPTDCYSCHQTEYEETPDPDHVASGFSFDCTMCHSTAEWTPAEFDHANTDFPLTGAHTELLCLDCHSEGYENTPVECYDCHSTGYSGAENPIHNLPSFSHECTDCHNTTAWDPSFFDHDTQTQYALEGAHSEVSCAMCHPAGVYDGTASDCWSCHETDYNEANDPDHASANFSHDCTQCHSLNGWSPAEFDHATTDFPLTGAHESLDCVACHSEGYSGTPTACYACHNTDYDNTSSPNHEAADFDTDCTECHTTTAWTPASWSHNDTDYPLTGAHITVDCALCHVNNQYNGTPTECFFCHQDDYNNADDPNHQSAGFPTDCTECHTTTAWDPATFNHLQWFPIYSGEHRGEWDTCSDCHTNANDFSVFSCIDCHEHNRNDMDDEHDDVGGYSYNSQACYDCHPDGRADDDRFIQDNVEQKAKRLDR